MTHEAKAVHAGREMISSSRIPGFAKLTSRGRIQALIDMGLLLTEDLAILQNTEGLPLEFADSFIENCIGQFALPLGVATNFLIDGKEVLIPMAVEESSVVAAASHGAKLARSAGGFFSHPALPIATAQVQVFAKEGEEFCRLFETIRSDLFALAESCHPKLKQRGGGVVEVELRSLAKPGYYVVHIHVDTCEAMGANIVNTIAEEIGCFLSKQMGLAVGLKILTNLTIKRITKVTCEVTPQALEIAGFKGDDAIERIIAAYEFADLDPFRAATHNKGIMNGIDPVVIATGNDWRAVEAGCHAYAAISGSYKPLTTWRRAPNSRNLQGTIAVPISVGTVGGVTRLHPAVQRAFRLLGNPGSERLSAIIAAVGLAQNLSALRALACEGIQRGHMALHEKNIEMMRRYDNLPKLTSVAREQESSN